MDVQCVKECLIQVSLGAPVQSLKHQPTKLSYDDPLDDK